MKTEYRKAIVEKPVYIADDGTEFEEEDECFDYEYNILKKSFECFDFDFNEAEIDECVFVDLPTKLIVKNFKECCDVCGLFSDGIEEPGLYIYTEYQGGRWVNMDNAMGRIRKELTNDQT